MAFASRWILMLLIFVLFAGLKVSNFSAAQALLPSETITPAQSEPISWNEDRPVSLRFTWGGGEPRAWEGYVRLLNADGKSIAGWQRLHLMSIERDAPGSALVDEQNKQLLIRSFRPLSYNSFQIDCLTERVDIDSAKLEIKMQVADQPQSQIVEFVALKDVLNENWTATLDQTGNGFWIERPKDDRLRFEFSSHASQIVTTGSLVEFQLHGHRAGFRPLTDVSWKIQLLPSHHGANVGEPLWQEQGQSQSTSEGHLESIGPLQFTAPLKPGVYELVAKLDASKTGMLPFAAKEHLVRKYQFVAVDKHSINLDNHFFSQERTQQPRDPITITPDQLSTGWPRLTEVPRLGVFPRLNPISLPTSTSYTTTGSAGLQVEQDDTGAWLELGAGQWRTISISDIDPGEYSLEVQYRNPSHSRIAVTVLHADRWGNYQTLHSGVGTWQQRLPWHWEERAEDLQVQQRIWVNDESKSQPLILVLQNSGNEPAAIGKIVLEARNSTLRQSITADKTANSRSIAMHLQTPLLATAFQAPKRTVDAAGTSLNDWSTIDKAADRLCHLLTDEGLSTVWLPVFSHGGSLFPSSLYQTSLRYENSGFNSELQYDQKLDAVELLLAKLAKDQLSMVPVFDFSGSLELIEQRAIKAGVNVTDDHRSGGSAGSYNPLSPLTQQCIAEILVDFLERYRKHSSLSGVAISLSDESQLLFQSEGQGLSPQIAADFFRDAGLSWDASRFGPLAESTFAQRQAFVFPVHRDVWLSWRAQRMTRFYQQLSTVAKNTMGDAKFSVTLVVDNWLDNPSIRSATLPNLRSNLDWRREALSLGVDLSAWNHQSQPFELVFQWGARPADGIVANRISSFRFHQDSSWQAMKARPNSLPVFQDPLEVLDLSSVPTPSGRIPGMQSLVSYVDPQSRTQQWSEILWWKDAKSLQRQSWGPGANATASELAFQESFQQLPKANFATVFQDPNCSIVVRAATVGQSDYFYLINAAPWTTTVHLNESLSPSSLQTLSQSNSGEAISWTAQADGLQCKMPAFSLAVFKCQTAPAFQSVTVTDEPEVSKRLNQVKDSLFRKLKLVGAPKAWPYLQNADFEDESNGGINGWTHSQSETTTFQLDPDLFHSGNQSLYVRSEADVAWLRSVPMSPVSTGRVSIAAWLRTRAKSPAKMIRLSIDGETPFGEKYYRFAEVEIGGAETSGEWQPVAAHFDDIPEAGLVSFRIGIDMMGAGEFWLDSVHCFDRWFDATDQKVLSNRLGLFSYALENRDNVYGAYQMLNDYWLNFLYAHFADPLIANSGSKLTVESESNGRPVRGKRRLFLR